MSSEWIAPLSALGGALIGASATLFSQWAVFRRNQSAQRRTAEMQIASQLRLWLTETTYDFSEHEIIEGSNPSKDPNDVGSAKVPEFPFENSFAVISSLSTEFAQDVFSLIERKLSAEKTASITLFLSTAEDSAEEFHARMAGIIVDAASLYSRMAKKLGWSKEALTKDEIDRWREKSMAESKTQRREQDVELV